MNWLAHLLLAESNSEARLGNLLGDLVKGEQRQALNPRLQRGIECHQAIDIFTDRHLIVKRSKYRINSEYRRFAGILIDVFYDYVLANNWQDYSDIALAEFTTTVYASWSDYLEALPFYPQGVVRRLIAEDWLGSYSTLAGIEDTLARISWRLNRRSKRNYDLTPAIAELTFNYLALEKDFQEFFPQLRLHINNWHLVS
ncbi:MAG TPA: ACP phosphodiesterase [Coleofasciculaceae cyanobacterium]|jgi:acyl carrier protein phosphodiesterase